MAKIREVRVGDWLELQNELFGETWNADLQRFRSDYVYRGMGNSNWDLHTSLWRLGGNFRELESHLLRNFRKYAQVKSRPKSQWTWLALAQHHGLPTRLLDWTYSPYVALHFATINVDQYNQEGVIWSVDYVKAHEMLPATLKRTLQSERSNAFTSEMLDRCADSIHDLEQMSDQGFVVFFEPPSLDERIVNQYALFSFMSDPETQFDDWIVENRPELIRRIVIPKELKWEARDKLDQANITERVLFPGLDGLCQWLRRHYMPRVDLDTDYSAEIEEFNQDPIRRKMRG